MNVSRRAGSARLDAALYAAATVTYVAAAVYNKWLLNWIVGPLWLIAWLQLVPAAARRFHRRSTPDRSLPPET